MSEETTLLRKELGLAELSQRLDQIEDIAYWRGLNPTATISRFPLRQARPDVSVSAAEIALHKAQLLEEGYFQTKPLLAVESLQKMRECIENVKRAGFPAMFALVYDVFYEAFAHFESVLTPMLGPDYQLVPNYWIYYIDTTDDSKGFEPHRDAEYPDTSGADGLPTVLTLWIALTEANPLNSCIYYVPASRDPQYVQATKDLKTGATQFALEDIRALPAQPGTLSCWGQYLFHWGSRGSKYAREPRISYAMYCQRKDIAPVDDALLDFSDPFDFETRLAIICRGIYRYSYLSLRESEAAQPLLAFMERYRALLTKPKTLYGAT